MTRIRRIAVEVPIDADITAADWERLFGLVADAVFDWEPADRDGWDTDVYATAICSAEFDEDTPENCSCGTMLAPCPGCCEWRCYRCDPQGSSDCDRWATKGDA